MRIQNSTVGGTLVGSCPASSLVFIAGSRPFAVRIFSQSVFFVAFHSECEAEVTRINADGV
jgi:hypothetical protein